MTRSKPTFSDGPTPQQRAARARDARRHTALRRKESDMMGFWRACSNRPCRRKRACAGDPHACFELFWPQVPEQEKEYIRGCIVALRHTRSADEIHRAGLARMEEYLKSLERFAARPAPAAPVRAPHPAASPQIRRL